jgi:hypothetical protein
MNVKHFSVAPSTLGAIATAIKMCRLGKKYINLEQFDVICLNIGREFIANLATDDKFEKILAAADKFADKAIEHEECNFKTNDHEVQNH